MIIGPVLACCATANSTLSEASEKSRSGIAGRRPQLDPAKPAACWRRAFRLAGPVRATAFMAGMHESLMISACLLFAAGAAIWRGRATATSS